MKLKAIVIVLAVVLLYSITQAQQKFKYTYDETGNRTKRELITPMALMAALDSGEVERTLDILSSKELQLVDSNDLSQQDAFTVQIYPNPSKGMYTVELPELQANEKGFMQVYNIMGQVVQEYRSLHNVQNVNITGALPGYYLMRIVIGDKVVSKTLIKQ